MKLLMVLCALSCTVVPVVHGQNMTVEQFMKDQSLQDSIVATIVSSHELMSKVINTIAQNRQLHEMVIQHLTRLLDESPRAGGGHDHASHETHSRYVGNETREIKALSASEVTSLLNGEGMGLAMAAELNHYPGPRHVLDLGDQLQLTRTQVRSVQESFDRMHMEAIRLGRQLVGKERALDKSFVSRSVGLESLKRLTKEIEELRGRLRDVHLAAHIEVRNVLTQTQIESYDRARGYTSSN
jgi:hypothetical protein